MNADGAPIEPTTASFPFEDPAALVKELAQRADLDNDEQQDRWLWVRDDDTVLGRLELFDQSLLLEVDSPGHLQAARAWLEALPGVHFEGSTVRTLADELPLDDRLPTPPEEPSTPEEIQAFERHALDLYYQWLDQPIPLLGDLTPREACATQEGRQRVARLAGDRGRGVREGCAPSSATMKRRWYARRDSNLNLGLASGAGAQRSDAARPRCRAGLGLRKDGRWGSPGEVQVQRLAPGRAGSPSCMTAQGPLLLPKRPLFVHTDIFALTKGTVRTIRIQAVKHSNPSDPHPKGSSDRLERSALALLRSAMERAGWKVHPSRSGRPQPDLLLRREQEAFAVELKASPGRARRAALRGRLADAILQSRVAAQDADAEPLVVLVAPAISDEIAGELADYVGRVAAGMAWGLIDDRGRFELHGEGLQDVQPPKQQAPSVERLRPEQPAHNPFSDLGQWMLKVLLSSNVPEPWLSAPRKNVRGMADLADLAQVSPASASRFLAALDAEAYIARSVAGLSLVRVEALLNAWRMSLQRPMEKRYARFLLPPADPQLRLQEVLANRSSQKEPLEAPSSAAIAARVGPKGQRACLGLFSACRALGLGFVRGAPLHLFSEDLSSAFLRELELHPVEHRAEAELIVLRPRFPESLFRGCVLVDGAPTADALQCWLDVSFQAARGEEQANAIAERLGLSEWDR